MAAQLKTVRSRWQGAVLVCGKCSKRAGGGFGADGRTTLAKALRAHGGGRKRKAAFGVVEVKCLGVCPKRGVVVVDASRPGEWRVMAPGSDVAALAARLGGGDGAGGGVLSGPLLDRRRQA